MFKDTCIAITREIENAVMEIDERKICSLIASIRGAGNIFCVGAGRSKIFLTAFCMRLNQLGFKAYVAGNVLCPPAGVGDLVISVTGSGTTPTVIAILERAKKAGAYIAVFTADSVSAQLADIADNIITIDAPSTLMHENERKSNQVMRTLFEQTAFISQEAIISMLSEGMDEKEIVGRHTNLE